MRACGRPASRRPHPARVRRFRWNHAATAGSGALQGRTDISIDTRGDGSWTGAILTEMVSTYTLTFLGPRAAITGTPPPTNVGGGFVQGGPFGLIAGLYFNIATRSGGVYGAYDAAAGRLEVPLFFDFDEGVRFPGVWNSWYGTRERSHASFLLSTETQLPQVLTDSTGFPSGTRIDADGNLVLVGIGTVSGGQRDGKAHAVVINGRLLAPVPGRSR